MRLPVDIDLGDIKRKVVFVFVNQVPSVGHELVLDPIDESRWPEQTQATSWSQTNTQRLIESYEMVHVRMRHEHVTDAQDFTRAEPAHIPRSKSIARLPKRNST